MQHLATKNSMTPQLFIGNLPQYSAITYSKLCGWEVSEEKCRKTFKTMAEWRFNRLIPNKGPTQGDVWRSNYWWVDLRKIDNLPLLSWWVIYARWILFSSFQNVMLSRKTLPQKSWGTDHNNLTKKYIAMESTLISIRNFSWTSLVNV